jgi:hypothetical protein
VPPGGTRGTRHSVRAVDRPVDDAADFRALVLDV